ncbi:hypothetical protein GCM10023226_21090 [Nocardioides nanhaiensis]|uniref:Chromosome condensation regulator RCC1 n=1 Tax=Nocardioides nanhaiensis TaxID=1476871 RepID=A0ABP8W845_9ACTN
MAVAACVLTLVAAPSAVADPSVAGGTTTAAAAAAKPAKPQLRAAQTRVEAGSQVRMVATVRPATSRPVRLERRAGARWRTVGQRSTTRKGRAVLRTTVPKAAGTYSYRAVTPRVRRAGRVLPFATSRVVRLQALPRTARGPRWRSVTQGRATTCGVRTDGSGWCWGENGRGQVGDGTRTDRSRPFRLDGEWRTLAVARDTVCGLRTDGSIWCWGANNRGQAGDGTYQDRDTPNRVAFTWTALTQSLDGTITCGIQTDRTAWCWGANDRGQVAEGSRLDRRIPHELFERGGARWRSVSPGLTGCGIRADGSGWCWGANDQGQTGTGGTEDVLLPRPVTAGPTEWRELASVDGSTCGLGADDSAWCWGRNEHGQAADGTTTARLAPRRLEGSWRSLDGAGASRCGVRTDGSGWCWGDNRRGQVGDGRTADRTTLHRLSGTWRSLQVGRSAANVCGVRTDASGWCWGANASGQLGDGTRALRRTPVRLPGRWIELRLEDTTACGRQSGAVGWCWGEGSQGQVGDGAGRDRLRPVRLPYRWRSLVSLSGSTCGLTSTGQAACWGANGSGQSGAGTTTDRTTPAVLR